MRTDLHPAFVLHRRPYRETSLHVEVFSRLYGRVAVLAKGANRRRSPLRCIAQMFTPLQVAWVGRSELGVLTAAESCSLPFVTDGRGLLSAFYLNELLMRILQRFDPHPALFDGYSASLDALGRQIEAEPVLRRFEVLLLAQIGYGLMLEKDAFGSCIDAEAIYSYQIERGPVPERHAVVDSVTVHGSTLLALALGEFSTKKVIDESKRLMRHILHPLLGGKPLRSRQLFITQRCSTCSTTSIQNNTET